MFFGIPRFLFIVCSPSHQMWKAATRSTAFRRTAFRRRAHLPAALSPRGGGGTNSSLESSSTILTNRVYLGVGSNLGDRFRNIWKAIHILCQSNDGEQKNGIDGSVVRMVRSSFLYETAPMYVTDQPSFLNGVVEVETDLEPADMLRRIKEVENQLGRNLNSGTRNGPRPVDLDILLYETRDAASSSGNSTGHWKSRVIRTSKLVVPHQRIQEREFVLQPLCDVASRDMLHPVLNKTLRELFHDLKSSMNQKIMVNDGDHDDHGDQDDDIPPPAIRVLPLPRGRMLYFNETIVMGILNVTPDSFSDGGKWSTSIDIAVRQALEMERKGAGIIDIGGESTRPGAKEISVKEQLQRTIAVIEGIRRVSDVPISIDTRRAQVARAAVDAGADIVNDVSGGAFDPCMLTTVAELGVPMVLMHMRGTPETMLSMTNYDNTVEDVAAALTATSRTAEKAGIPRWLQIVDPGIGFAKDLQGNLLLMKNIQKLRSATSNLPILLGTSRKGFIGKITSETDPERRDFGTVASFVACFCLDRGFDDDATNGCSNIVRVHNVAAAKQATLVMDAIKGVDEH